MSKFLTPRLARAAAGTAVLCAFAVAPIAAQAAPTPPTSSAATDATGTLSAGGLTVTAPAIAPFTAILTGVNQTVDTAVGSWNVTDATGTGSGYDVTVAATAPTVGGNAAAAGTGGSLTLTPSTATAALGNPAPVGPVAGAPVVLNTVGSTIDTAAPGTGQGEWDFAADSGSTQNLAVVIPGDASAGNYSSTLTYTVAPSVG